MTVGTPVFVVAVVDDDQGILQSLEYLLESADYAVRLFASACGLAGKRLPCGDRLPDL
jgi:FixJ family two-component response regulator